MLLDDIPPAQFQTFEVKSDPEKVAPRLTLLRKTMENSGVDAFLVPRADAHRGESVPPGDARLAYLTGFTGSAGLAVVGRSKAALFVDSRYTLQAPAQTDTRKFDVVEINQAAMPAGIASYVRKGGVVGYDPWLHTPGEIRDLEGKLAGHATLRPLDNLVDAIWPDRPAAPVTPVETLGDNRAGKSSAQKIAELQATLAADKADATVLTLPDSICWLLNIRARDVPNTPFLLGFCIVPRRGRPTLYLAPEKITAELRAALGDRVALAPTGKLLPAITRLAAGGRRIAIDPASCPVAIVEAAKAGNAEAVLEKPDPVRLPKARKNDAEIGGMKEAHRIDGVAMARFLAWFDEAAPKGGLDEITVVSALEAFRRADASAVDNSFDTIAGAGANGAIVHYRVDRKSNRMLVPGELMLVDSGGQYLSGTTDITRTISSGPAGSEEKDRFTRVLKGMIAISTARFPKGTSGAQIDILARQFLWQAGVTYNHGTGHGVGAFLSVHEGPIGISSRFSTPLEPGMILSNEPGYYKSGAYGIRIENLVLVIPSDVGDGWLEFETLTLAPIDRRLIDLALLLPHEREWLDAYHRRVLNEIGPLVEPRVRAWLEKATAPL
ncbi:Xaa-Pro aminopeptidase [Devosia enhydra]|uniref:Xaa-Pro aminopeptidase n=1 Tax=Devosia enhydra TaxID=665118 RepID=A0A1K2HW75_9HYPH|nr:aminopeptidase P family protein [Devosia enhydra]SFZ82844.1 Xaa-Pro aminopeptidase [Devosia enhydra]